MKIRIAKKKLKKVISEAYRINKRRVKLSRTYLLLEVDMVIGIATVALIITL